MYKVLWLTKSRSSSWRRPRGDICSGIFTEINFAVSAIQLSFSTAATNRLLRFYPDNKENFFFNVDSRCCIRTKHLPSPQCRSSEGNCPGTSALFPLASSKVTSGDSWLFPKQFNTTRDAFVRNSRSPWTSLLQFFRFTSMELKNITWKTFCFCLLDSIFTKQIFIPKP